MMVSFRSLGADFKGKLGVGGHHFLWLLSRLASGHRPRQAKLRHPELLRTYLSVTFLLDEAEAVS